MMKDFIEYDNHNGVTLLKVCIINSLNRIYYDKDKTIELYHIPFSLLTDCLYDNRLEYGWDYCIDWIDKDCFLIEVHCRLDDRNLFKISGNIIDGKITITSK